MEYEIVHIENQYLLILDKEADIEAGVTPVLNSVAPFHIGSPCRISLSRSKPFSSDGRVNLFQGIHKIIAHLPLEDSPVIKGVGLLPNLDKKKIEALALEEINKLAYFPSDLKEFAIAWFVIGYEKSIKEGDSDLTVPIKFKKTNVGDIQWEGEYIFSNK